MRSTQPHPKPCAAGEGKRARKEKAALLDEVWGDTLSDAIKGLENSATVNSSRQNTWVRTLEVLQAEIRKCEEKRQSVLKMKTKTGVGFQNGVRTYNNLLKSAFAKAKKANVLPNTLMLHMDPGIEAKINGLLKKDAEERKRLKTKKLLRQNYKKVHKVSPPPSLAGSDSEVEDSDSDGDDGDEDAKKQKAIEKEEKRKKKKDDAKKAEVDANPYVTSFKELLEAFDTSVAQSGMVTKEGLGPVTYDSDKRQLLVPGAEPADLTALKVLDPELEYFFAARILELRTLYDILQIRFSTGIGWRQDNDEESLADSDSDSDSGDDAPVIVQGATSLTNVDDVAKEGDIFKSTVITELNYWAPGTGNQLKPVFENGEIARFIKIMERALPWSNTMDAFDFKERYGDAAKWPVRHQEEDSAWWVGVPRSCPWNIEVGHNDPKHYQTIEEKAQTPLKTQVENELEKRGERSIEEVMHSMEITRWREMNLNPFVMVLEKYDKWAIQNKQAAVDVIEKTHKNAKQAIKNEYEQLVECKVKYKTAMETRIALDEQIRERKYKLCPRLKRLEAETIAAMTDYYDIKYQQKVTKAIFYHHHGGVFAPLEKLYKEAKRAHKKQTTEYNSAEVKTKKQRLETEKAYRFYKNAEQTTDRENADAVNALDRLKRDYTQKNAILTQMENDLTKMHPGEFTHQEPTPTDRKLDGDYAYPEGVEWQKQLDRETKWNESAAGKQAMDFKKLNDRIMAPYDARAYPIMLRHLKCYPLSKELAYRSFYDDKRLPDGQSVRNNWTAGMSLETQMGDGFPEEVRKHWVNAGTPKVVTDLSPFEFLTGYCDEEQKIPWVNEGPGRPFDINPKKVKGKELKSAKTGVGEGKRGEQGYEQYNAWKIATEGWDPKDDNDYPGIDEQMCTLYKKRIAAYSEEGVQVDKGAKLTQWLKTATMDRARRDHTQIREKTTTLPMPKVEMKKVDQLSSSGMIDDENDDNRLEIQGANKLEEMIETIKKVASQASQQPIPVETGVIPCVATRQLHEKINLIIRFSEGCVWNDIADSAVLKYQPAPQMFGNFRYRNLNDLPGIPWKESDSIISKDDVSEEGEEDKQDDKEDLMQKELENALNSDEDEFDDAEETDSEVSEEAQEDELDNAEGRDAEISEKDLFGDEDEDEAEGQEAEGQEARGAEGAEEAGDDLVVIEGANNAASEPDAYNLLAVMQKYKEHELDDEAYLKIQEDENKSSITFGYKIYEPKDNSYDMPRLVLKPYAAVYNAVNQELKVNYRNLARFYKEDYEHVSKLCATWWTAYQDGKDAAEADPSILLSRATDPNDIVWGPGNDNFKFNNIKWSAVDKKNRALPMRERPLNGTYFDVKALRMGKIVDDFVGNAWERLVKHRNMPNIYEYWDPGQEIWSPILNGVPYAYNSKVGDWQKRETMPGNNSVFMDVESPQAWQEAAANDIEKLDLDQMKEEKRCADDYSLSNEERDRLNNVQSEPMGPVDSTSDDEGDGENDSESEPRTDHDSLSGDEDMWDEAAEGDEDMWDEAVQGDQEEGEMGDNQEETATEAIYRPTKNVKGQKMKAKSRTFAERWTSILVDGDGSYANRVATDANSIVVYLDAGDRTLEATVYPGAPPEAAVCCVNDTLYGFKNKFDHQWIPDTDSNQYRQCASEDVFAAEKLAIESNTQPENVPLLNMTVPERMFLQWFNESKPYAAGNEEHTRSLRVLLSSSEMRFKIDPESLPPELQQARQERMRSMQYSMTRNRMKEIGMVCNILTDVLNPFNENSSDGILLVPGEPPIHEKQNDVTLYWIHPKHNFTVQIPVKGGKNGEKRTVIPKDCFGVWDPFSANWIYFPDRKVVPIEDRHAPIGLGYAIDPRLGPHEPVDEDATYKTGDYNPIHAYIYEGTGMTPGVISKLLNRSVDDQGELPVYNGVQPMSTDVSAGKRALDEEGGNNRDGSGASKQPRGAMDDLLTAKHGWGNVVENTEFDAVCYTPNLRHVKPLIDHRIPTDWTTVYTRPIPPWEFEGQLSTDNGYESEAFWNATNSVWVYMLSDAKRMQPTKIPLLQSRTTPISGDYIDETDGDAALLNKWRGTRAELIQTLKRFYDFPWDNDDEDLNVPCESTSASADMSTVPKSTSCKNTRMPRFGQMTLLRRERALEIAMEKKSAALNQRQRQLEGL